MSVYKARFPGIALFSLTLALSASVAAQQQPAQASSSDGAAKIQVTVTSVLVPVVVRDAQGHAIANLKKEDFQIFDNNKEQTLSGFSIQQRALAPSGTSDPQPPQIPPSPQPSAATPATSAAPERYIVFLFDDLHLAAADLQQAQQTATKMMAGALGNSDAAAVVSFSGANSGLTNDRAKLNAAILNLRTQNLYRHDKHDCPDVDYYQADLIENKHDIQAMDAAVDEAMSCAHLDSRDTAEELARSTARQAIATGDQDVLVALGFLRSVVQKMESLPGQRSLILVSPGFLTVTPAAMYQKSQVLDAAAKANVTISAMDARGLYVSDRDVTEHGATGSSLRIGQTAQYDRNAMSLNEDVMAELADGSGGTYVHNSNDLAGGFQKLAAAPEYVYVLELSLEKVKQDGSYHALRVKVNQKDANLQARRGYFAPRKAKK
jgi:VWFA-related protein